MLPPTHLNLGRHGAILRSIERSVASALKKGRKYQHTRKEDRVMRADARNRNRPGDLIVGAFNVCTLAVKGASVFDDA